MLVPVPVPVPVVQRRRDLVRARILPVSMLVPMSHLRREARAPASAHESVPPEIGHLERGHLPRDLPELTREENDRPKELHRRPHRDGEEESVGRRECTDRCREEARRRERGLKVGCREICGAIIVEDVSGEIARGVLTGKGEIVEKDDPDNKRCYEKNELSMIMDANYKFMNERLH